VSRRVGERLVVRRPDGVTVTFTGPTAWLLSRDPEPPLLTLAVGPQYRTETGQLRRRYVRVVDPDWSPQPVWVRHQGWRYWRSGGAVAAEPA